MSRPDFITNEDIARWSDQIDSEEGLHTLASFPVVREVCYAGLWLVEQLREQQCSEELIVRIQYTAGQLSFGRDPWEIHQEIADKYRRGDLEFEIDYDAN